MWNGGPATLSYAKLRVSYSNAKEIKLPDAIARVANTPYIPKLSIDSSATHSNYEIVYIRKTRKGELLIRKMDCRVGTVGFCSLVEQTGFP